MAEDTGTNRLGYYLIAGNVVMRDGEDVHSILANAVATSEEPVMGVHFLSKAQQALQVSVFNKMGEIHEVVDVLILNIIYLGHMTEQEFNARPEGLAVQARDTAVMTEDPFANDMADRVMVQ